jgi:hypothetical protein
MALLGLLIAFFVILPGAALLAPDGSLGWIVIPLAVAGIVAMLYEGKGSEEGRTGGRSFSEMRGARELMEASEARSLT